MARERKDIEELLIWAYQRQAVDKASTGAAAACLGFGSGAMRVDGGVQGGGVARLVFGASVHPDAEAIHAAVMRPEKKGGLSSLARGLVMENARSGAQPDWMPGARPVMASVLNNRGNHAMIYDGNRTEVGCKIVEAVAVQGIGGDVIRRGMPHSHIVMMREAYVLWWEALSFLAQCLKKAGLEAYDVTGPAAPNRPWEGRPNADGTKAA